MTRLVRLEPRERRLVWLCTAAFVLLAADVMVGGLVARLDVELRDQLVAHGASAPALLAPLGEIGDLAIAIPIVVAAGAVSAQVLWRLWPAVFAAVTLGVTELLVLLTKTIVARPGPGVWADRVGYPGYFPSGHTATATVTIGIVVFLVLVVPGQHVRLPRAPMRCLVWGWVVGASAGVYAVLGDYHWFSDVLGGLALATVVLVVGCAAVRSRLAAPETADRVA